jgi:hypothetical protein
MKQWLFAGLVLTVLRQTGDGGAHTNTSDGFPLLLPSDSRKPVNDDKTAAAAAGELALLLTRKDSFYKCRKERVLCNQLQNMYKFCASTFQPRPAGTIQKSARIRCVTRQLAAKRSELQRFLVRCLFVYLISIWMPSFLQFILMKQLKSHRLNQ